MGKCGGKVKKTAPCADTGSDMAARKKRVLLYLLAALAVGGGAAVAVSACGEELADMLWKGLDSSTASYIVALEHQGGEGGTETVEARMGRQLPVIAPPWREGYFFGGYYSGTNGTGTAYYDPNGVGAIWPYDNGGTLYAYWPVTDRSTFTVTLDLAEGREGTESVQATMNHALPDIRVPQRHPYTFLGYFTGRGGTGTQYYTRDGTSARPWNIPNDYILYAYWQDLSYTVVYDGNEADGGSMENSVFSRDVEETLRANAYTRSGYSFAGWSDGVYVRTYADKETVRNLAEAGKTITLQAQWTPSSYIDLTSAEYRGEGISFSNDTFTLSNNAVVLVRGSTSTYTIVVAPSHKATIAMENIEIDMSGYYGWHGDNNTPPRHPIDLTNAELTIVLAGDVNGRENKLKGFNSSGRGSCGICLNSLGWYHRNEEVKAKLTIKGQGRLRAEGGFGCAGIGGTVDSDNGEIVIESGTITATTANQGGGAAIGGGGAGMYYSVGYAPPDNTYRDALPGGGYGYPASYGVPVNPYEGGRGEIQPAVSFSTTGDGGKITITGGDVTAVAGYGGAGIGGGDEGRAGVIRIEGGRIVASGLRVSRYYGWGCPVGPGDLCRWHSAYNAISESENILYIRGVQTPFPTNQVYTYP